MTATVRADAVVRPWWGRARLWLIAAAVVVVAAIALAALAGTPGRSLDPRSASPDGSRALARVLADYGTRVIRTSDLDTARAATGTVLVTSPDDYSDAQLRRLTRAPRLVALRPGTRATTALLPGASPDPETDPDTQPGCGATGAAAAGVVDLPGDALVYDLGGTGTSCYGGAVVQRGSTVLLGSRELLRNDRLTREGVAALDVNLLSADRTSTTLVWLLPGADAGGSGPASVWDLFPDGVHRAFWWLLLVGVLVVLWRARRLGGVVREPLPVVVRAAELVEGHGRLYERAAARDRAADTLRAATTARLVRRLALPRGSSPQQVTAALAPRVQRNPADVWAVLAGAVPADDAGLVRLAADLDALEAAVDDTRGHA
ncbi:DUF4350 domain-containing protein [uncultured Jatrophihabitans sp.]|uniref:DUF4350 domain-containing protein n=1 Tax=uncultured Jatrophihabitans sp. TaxID=1610747 RepID=UPI0035CA1330